MFQVYPLYFLQVGFDEATQPFLTIVDSCTDVRAPLLFVLYAWTTYSTSDILWLNLLVSLCGFTKGEREIHSKRDEASKGPAQRPIAPSPAMSLNHTLTSHPCNTPDLSGSHATPFQQTHSPHPSLYSPRLQNTLTPPQPHTTLFSLFPQNSFHYFPLSLCRAVPCSLPLIFTKHVNNNFSTHSYTLPDLSPFSLFSIIIITVPYLLIIPCTS